MIQLYFNDDMVKQAIKKAQMLGHLHNSITMGQANAAGYLGEESLATYLGIKNSSNDDDKYNRDLVLPDGKTVEVKTKRRTVDPLEDYEVSVAETSNHQKPDLYAFLSITFGVRIGYGRKAQYDNPLRIWLCGFCEYEKFWANAVRWDGSMIDTNNYVPSVPHYNLKIMKLSKSII